MKTREFTCVVCPNGCSIVVDVDDDENPVVTRVQGNTCKRGEAWARQEVENPMRTIASSVPVRGGDFLLASVRTSRPVPLAKIRAVMTEIRKVSLTAPVRIGEVIIPRPAGCDTDIVVTRTVARIAREALK